MPSTSSVPPTSRSRPRAVCFTLNNYGPADLERLRCLVLDTNLVPKVRYAIFGLERGENGTHHIQGYISSLTARAFTTWKEAIGQRAHIEAAKGSAFDSKAYCSKEGNFEEYGTIPQPGKRNDVHEACEALAAGKRIAEVAADHPVVFLRYARNMVAFQRLVCPVADPPEKCTVRVYWGPSGTGKSRRSREEAEAITSLYVKPAATGIWWPRYGGERAVLFDDYYGYIPYDQLLTLLDRYNGRQVQIKGGDEPFLAREIWITSNAPISEWYPKEDGIALYRRISVYEEMLDDGVISDMSSRITSRLNW
nr:MAG: replication associated protein [Cressdnaviricota sp.]